MNTPQKSVFANEVQAVSGIVSRDQPASQMMQNLIDRYESLHATNKAAFVYALVGEIAVHVGRGKGSPVIEIKN